MHFRKIAVSLLLVQAASAHPPAYQRNRGPSHLPYQTHAERISAIKEAFRRSWTGYRKHAFPFDTLRPVSNTGVNDR